MICHTVCCTHSYIYILINICIYTCIPTQIYIHLLVLSALVVLIRNEHVHFSSHVAISHRTWTGREGAPLGVLSAVIPLSIFLYISTGYMVLRQMPSSFAFVQKAPRNFWRKNTWCSAAFGHPERRQTRRRI